MLARVSTHEKQHYPVYCISLLTNAHFPSMVTTIIYAHKAVCSERRMLLRGVASMTSSPLWSYSTDKNSGCWTRYGFASEVLGWLYMSNQRQLTLVPSSLGPLLTFQCLVQHGMSWRWGYNTSSSQWTFIEHTINNSAGKLAIRHQR